MAFSLASFPILLRAVGGFSPLGCGFGFSLGCSGTRVFALSSVFSFLQVVVGSVFEELAQCRVYLYVLLGLVEAVELLEWLC